ncbi:uncharacterized protein LOC142563952 isoform X2 [Dermacentor variabilis]|uniref:uncharacterized protein LOC142563952 isoform X2 n=1 Tax=Dermacentor variabilis TaxID=34621 RepID=UPI003F5ADE9F
MAELRAWLCIEVELKFQCKIGDLEEKLKAVAEVFSCKEQRECTFIDIRKHLQGHLKRALINECMISTRYPGRLYTEAARALTTKFPNLADATGTGHDSWREPLRYKAKYERKKVRTLTKEDTENLQPRKRAAVEECAAPVRCERPSTATAMAEGENAESIAFHISVTAKESLKARPDMAYIEDFMNRTLATRREWVVKESPSVAEMHLLRRAPLCSWNSGS